MSAAAKVAPLKNTPEPLPPELYRQVVDQADLAISITDPRANILYTNEAFTRVTGYPANEVVGRNESVLSNHSTPRHMYAEMWAHLTAGQAWTGRLLNRRKDASVYLAELSITPVHDADDRITHYLGMHRDVTALHRLECEVRNQKRLIESVVDAAPVVFALLDANGQVMLDNHEYKKLVADLGVGEPAHTLMDCLLPDWREQLVVRPSDCQFDNREIRVDQRGGKARWFSCTTALIRMADESADGFFCGEHLTGLLLAVSDVTGLRAEQERSRIAALAAMLADAERVASIRESLSAAVYRLDEPMNVMSSAVSLLKRRDPTSARVLEDALATSRAYVDNLRQVIPPQGSEIVTLVNLNEVLRDVLDICTGRLLGAGVRVEWKPALTLPHFTGRPIQLRVLFKALLENAIEALNTRGWSRRELCVGTELKQDCVLVRLSDTGPGMTDEVKLRAFEPFFTTRTGSTRHLGTGLARAQQIVADHGGMIDLEDNPRGGTTVTVEFRMDGDPL